MKTIFLCLFLLCALAQAEPQTQSKTEPCYKIGMSAELLTQCANQGDADAQNNLGMIYLQGQGVVKDDKAAFQWFSKAAQQNQADAQNALGVIYEKGYGLPIDTKKAFEWYSKAAEQNHVGAQNNLSFMYAYGIGVKQDLVLAYMWSTLAVTQGYTAATKLRDTLIASITSEQKKSAEKMVNEWFTKHPTK